MRNAFADEITKLGAADPRVVLLSGDIGNKLFDKYKDENEDRFFNCGVAEANMMGMAAGLALNGLRPVVYTITPFTTTRCLEQIRVDACYHRVPVIIVGTGSGLSYVDLGPTHHSCEDIALLRALPEMTVLCPCDAVELRAALRAALQHDGPVYMRIGKKGEPILHQTPPDFAIGRAITMREGSDVCIISTGNVMPMALTASDQLAADGISARVESFHTVKPLDTARLAELFARYRVVASVEEHSRIGGLASAIAEWLAAQPRQKADFTGFSLADRFLHEVGSQDYARRQLGLSPEIVVAGIKRAVAASAAA
jgi:transketolase